MPQTRKAPEPPRFSDDPSATANTAAAPAPSAMPPPARPTTTATTGTTTLFGRNRPTTSAAPSALLTRGGGKLPANHSNRRHDELADMQTTESGMNHMDYMAAGDMDGEEATQGVIERARLEAAKRRKVESGHCVGN